MIVDYDSPECDHLTEEQKEQFRKLESTLSQNQKVKQKLRTPRVSSAAEWLESYLQHGPISATEVLRTSSEEGHKIQSLYKAKKELGIISTRIGSANPPYWQWELPTPTQQTESYQIL